MARRTARRSASLLIACAAVLLAAPAAYAHGELVATYPADGAVLSEPPQEISLWFSEEIVDGFVNVRIFGPSGLAVPGVSWSTDPSDPVRLRVSPGSLDRGVYLLEWSAAFEEDPHPAEGGLVFRIGGGDPPGVGATSVDESVVPWGEASLRWMTLLALAGLIGSIAVHSLVLPQDAHAARSRTASMATACGIASAVLIGGQLALGAKQLSDAGSASFARALFSAMTTTGWGIRAVLALLLAGALAWASLRAHAGSERALLLLAPPLAVAIAVIEGMSGHAAEVPQASSASVLADAVHLLAAGVWMGGAAALLAAFPPGRDETEPRLDVRGAWRRFATVAGVSVALLAATGMYALADRTGIEVGSTQGKGLGIMIGAFLVAALLGGANFLWLRRRGPARGASVPRLVQLEIGFGLVAFLAAAAVASVPLGLGPEGEVGTAPIQALDAEDLIVTVEVSPNAPGQNAVMVLVASQVRPAAGRIVSVSASTEGAAQEFRRAGVGRFRAVMDLPAGAVDLSVRVERAGASDVVVEVPWSVAPAPRVGEPGPPPRSRFLLLGAATIMVVLGAGVAWTLTSPARRRSVAPIDRGRSGFNPPVPGSRRRSSSTSPALQDPDPAACSSGPESTPAARLSR